MGRVWTKITQGLAGHDPLYVEDADAFFARAVQAGAKATMPLEDAFWGDRYGKVEDPFGHQWSIATHLRDVTPEEMEKGMAEMCS